MKTKHKIAIGVGIVGVASAMIVGSMNALPQGIVPTVPGVSNPDVVQSNIQENICNPNWSTKSIRPPVSYTNPLKEKLLQDPANLVNGDTNPADYELDHLVSLTDGGNPTDHNNLWLEPYSVDWKGNQYGAREKDTFEIGVHRGICTGAISLQQGQDELRNWYKYYKPTPSSSGQLGDIIIDEDDN